MTLWTPGTVYADGQVEGAMDVSLVRVGQSESGTYGILRYEGIPFAVTLEQPWRYNEPNVSCIPTGRYTCRRLRSPKFGDTFQVTNVPNRTDILFHKGNTVEDTHGCILIAEEFSGTFDKPMIVSSQRGFHEFLQMLDGQMTFELVISKCHE